MYQNKQMLPLNFCYEPHTYIIQMYQLIVVL